MKYFLFMLLIMFSNNILALKSCAPNVIKDWECDARYVATMAMYIEPLCRC